MRSSIQVPGLGHGTQPTPTAARIGGLVMSGALFGRDRATGQLGEGLERQCALMFDNVEATLQAAGGGFGDVLKMTFFLRPGESREPINVEWINAFPDADSRPARHVIVSDTLPEGMRIQCDVFAVVGAASAG